MITRKEARSIVRKALKRVPEGEEIRHLNIMPMMDIMTILLVAFLAQVNLVDSSFELGGVELAESRSLDEMPERANAVVITKSAIVVEGEVIVSVKNGDVDASEKKDGALGIQIPKVSRFLGYLRQSDEEELERKGKERPAHPELFIIADKSTPYKLLFQVIASSRAEQAGYRRFRLIVLRAD